MAETVIFYSTHCPKCRVLQMKLDRAGVSYTECDDVDLMISKGLKSAPALEVDGEILDFVSAVRWADDQRTNAGGE